MIRIYHSLSVTADIQKHKINPTKVTYTGSGVVSVTVSLKT